MDTMINFGEDTSASYLSDWVERKEQGVPSPLDRANNAVEKAAQARAIFSESTDENNVAANESRFARIVQAASACGLATKKGEDKLAAEFARVAESEAVTLDNYDSSKLDGLRRPEIFSVVA